MIAVREGRGPWTSSQFELQRLIGSGKTSNVYQVLACMPSGITCPLSCKHLHRRRAAFALVWLWH